jgi:hypothetical protein
MRPIKQPANLFCTDSVMKFMLQSGKFCSRGQGL